MIRKLSIIGITVLLLWGCKADNKVNPEKVIEVTLRNSQEYRHDFQISGDEEGATIKMQPQHYAVSELVRNESTQWSVTYLYRPEPGYVGTDFAVIETCTGGGEFCTNFKTVRINFTIISE